MNKKVAYFYNQEIGKYYYTKDHPMKPKRIAMTHQLIVNFNLYRLLHVYRGRQATRQELLSFHNPGYIDYLQNYVDPDIAKKLANNGYIRGIIDQEQRKNNIADIAKRQLYNVGYSSDCPGFSGLYNFSLLSAGSSIDSAHVIMQGAADISINWGGGLHHAKKCQSSGFCYINDIVLCVLQLLKQYPRVLYLDIDVHHGDGVQQAFFLTNRVLTVSFHQYQKNFFPGTGGLDSVGEGPGKYYAINVPLKSGISDSMYFQLFKGITIQIDVMQRVMAAYRPNALVMQLGADSLANDKLGNFNLSIKGHGDCLKHMLRFNIPTILLGGGGYTVANVSRCWAYQTGIALGEQLDGNIPKSDHFYENYDNDYKLHFGVKSIENKNTLEQINKIKQSVFEQLRFIQSAPGIQFHDIPKQFLQFQQVKIHNGKQKQ